VAIDLAVQVELQTRLESYRLVQDDEVVEADTVEELSESPDAALVGLIASRLGLPPVEVRVSSASPRGGGLGASSALAVALIAAAEALTGRPPSSPRERGALARDLEAVLMGFPTGCQDHYPALFGGALEISHRAGGESVRQLDTDLADLGQSLLVAYSGQTHFSAGKNWEVIKRRLNGDPEMFERFQQIADVAARLSAALEEGDLERVGALMSEEWSCRRSLAPGVSTPQIEELLARGRAEGAWGGKACGAGGGGCVAILLPGSRRRAVERALSAAGAQILAARPTALPLSLTQL
jgi:D-glycero-alpha-D-manno-heptose-7-phosphate kinase